MGLNLIELPYLVFRLAPIIIISFFVLQSFLIWDLKGVIYISGLLLTCLITIGTSTGLQRLFSDTEPLMNHTRCTTFSLGENGEYYSKIPLNLVVYSFTFFYLLIFIFNLANKDPSKGILDTTDYKQTNINVALQQNVPVLVFFPLLILAELWWLNINSCLGANNFALLALLGVLLGGIGGVIWAVMVTSMGVPSLQYIVSKREDVCSRPTKSLFRCKPKVST
jgi:hypothetical protein